MPVTSCSSRSARLADTTTVAPSLARATAVAHPIPADAPVTTATEPLISTALQAGQRGERLAAVHDQHCPGDERRRRRAEEQGRPCDVLGLPPSAQWDRGQNVL